MRAALNWILRQGIVSTFLSGLFVILPIIVTLAILAWLVEQLQSVLGPSSTLGQAMRRVGLQFVGDDATAWIIGLLATFAGIWLLGVLVKTRARNRIQAAIDAVIGNIPVVKPIYGTVSQIVALLNRSEQPAELAGMNVVFCTLDSATGPGFVCLLASPSVFRFGDREFRAVYVPTSPIPMTGWVMFVPASQVRPLDMSADEMMQIYLSLGVRTPNVVPQGHVMAAETSLDKGQALGRTND
ncbi:MAG: DUF502 domain-containing protein [Pirellulales bacterium]|nr:DUF502 domain-containing protein [Pirellulales bacterium]